MRRRRLRRKRLAMLIAIVLVLIAAVVLLVKSIKVRAEKEEPTPSAAPIEAVTPTPTPTPIPTPTPTPEPEILEGYVTASVVNVRQSPSTDAEVLGKLVTNETVTILGEEGDWYHIQSYQLDGYILKEFIMVPSQIQAPEGTEETEGESGKVTATSLNLRAQPSTQGEVLRVLANGAEVTVLAEQNGWLYVQAGSQKGYLTAEYVLRESDLTLKVISENVYFYDKVADEYKDVGKEFYWIQYQGAPRRYDSKIPAQYFDMQDNGKWIVSKEIQDLTKKMARKLYNATENVSVNCYYGQYYPSGEDPQGQECATGIHEGIDFGGPAIDADFYSLTDGVVTSVQKSDNNQEYSWVGIKTGNYTVFYVHGSDYYVNVGDTVKKGQRIGSQGDLGAAGAYHVHLELVSGDAKSFNYSKDTNLINECPYEFWKEQMA